MFLILNLLGTRFLGSEIGNQVAFSAVADGVGARFMIPPNAIGRYIQVVATRRVEHQVDHTHPSMMQFK